MMSKVSILVVYTGDKVCFLHFSSLQCEGIHGIKHLSKRQRIKHDPKPVYLGVTLDWALMYHDHLRKIAAKIGTRNNVLSKIAGAKLGAHASTFRTSALALCHSAAEYCAPVWARSHHTNLIDVKLNAIMRIVSGTLRPTPLPWLLVLSNIPIPILGGRRPRQSYQEKLLAMTDFIVC